MKNRSFLTLPLLSDVLKRVQLGHSIKDIVDKYPRRVCYS